jgi:hypothetical protein
VWGGGKSGLRRIGCQVTPGGREPTESATESRPPKSLAGPARVKRCGKSAPRRWQHTTARQTPPGARPNREAASAPLNRGERSADPRALPGRPLEVHGDVNPRGMIALDRTRLTGRLFLRAARGIYEVRERREPRTRNWERDRNALRAGSTRFAKDANLVRVTGKETETRCARDLRGSRKTRTPCVRPSARMANHVHHPRSFHHLELRPPRRATLFRGRRPAGRLGLGT